MVLGAAGSAVPLRGRGLRDADVAGAGGVPVMSFDRPRSSGEAKPDPPDGQRPAEQPVGGRQPDAVPARPVEDPRSVAEYRAVMSRPPIQRDRPVRPAADSQPHADAARPVAPNGARYAEEQRAAYENASLALEPSKRDAARDAAQGKPGYETPRHEGMQRSETANPAREAAKTGIADSGVGCSADAVSPAEEALRKRVAELEANKTALDRKIADQDRKISDQDRKLAVQGKQVEELKAENADQDSTNAALWKKISEQDVKIADRDKKLDDLTAGLGELLKERDHSEAKPSGRIDHRTDGGQGEDSERGEGRRKWERPSDAALSFGVALAGGAATTASGYAHYISPDAAGIGTAVATAGVAGVAWIRELRSRKAKANADHRSEG
jgi:hypothetical protein